MNDRVAGYRDLVESIAFGLARTQRAKQVGAEYDDLAQMGLIAVWRALESGVDVVGPDHIRNRMRDYMKHLGGGTQMPYDELLPLHDETAAP